MIRLFQLLFHGCAHVWEDTGANRYSDDMGNCGPIVYCKCVKCGRHTYFKDATMKRWN